VFQAVPLVQPLASVRSCRMKIDQSLVSNLGADCSECSDQREFSAGQ
jgi:hypothetical protein